MQTKKKEEENYDMRQIEQKEKSDTNPDLIL